MTGPGDGTATRPPVRPYGDTGNAAVVSASRPHVERSAGWVTHHGLHQDCIFVHAALRDEQGGRWVVSRRVKHTDSVMGLEILSDRTGEAAGLVPEPAARLGYARFLERAVENDAHVMRTWKRPSDDRQPVEIRHTASDLGWHEGELVSLRGTAVAGAGVQWYVPGPDGGVMWAAHPYAVEGSVLGTPVSGLASWDACYTPPGVDWFDTRFSRRGPAFWAVFLNRYGDGRVETGQVGVGEDGWRLAATLASEGNVRATTQVTVRAGSPGSGRVEFDVDDESWVWAEEAPVAGRAGRHRRAWGAVTRASEAAPVSSVGCALLRGAGAG